MASERVHIPIDKFGRVVLPKEIRDRLGVRPGTEFEVEEEADRIFLRPVVQKAKIIDRNGWLVVETGQPVTLEMVNQSIQESRREKRWR